LPFECTILYSEWLQISVVNNNASFLFNDVITIPVRGVSMVGRLRLVKQERMLKEDVRAYCMVITWHWPASNQ